MKYKEASAAKPSFGFLALTSLRTATVVSILLW